MKDTDKQTNNARLEDHRLPSDKGLYQGMKNTKDWATE